MRSFHDRLKTVTEDLKKQVTMGTNSIKYASEWIARLQLRNDIIKIASNKQLEQIADLTIERDTLRHSDTLKWQADQLSEAILEIAELNRKLDAANELLHAKDVRSADLRRNRDALREEVTDVRGKLAIATKAIEMMTGNYEGCKLNRDNLRTTNDDKALEVSRLSEELDNRNARIRELEACNAQQVKLLEESRVLDYEDCLNNINSLVYGVLGRYQR